MSPHVSKTERLPVSRASGRGRWVLPLWLMGGWIGASATAALLDHWGVLIPVCGLRLLTGLPCPLCGGTRALAAVARFDWWTALALNPLVCLAGVGLAIWSLVWCLDRCRGVDLGDAVSRRWLGKNGLRALVVLTLLNWAYLLVRPPQ